MASPHSAEAKQDQKREADEWLAKHPR